LLICSQESYMSLTHALVRPPGDSFAAAISSTNAAIDVTLAQAQHAEYCQALAAAGLIVEALPRDERFPDSCFMQDPAVVIGGRAVVGRPGAPSRQGEEDAAAAALTDRFPLTRLIPPATLEGGDVLILPDRVVVGRSGRTNAAGIAQLAVALARTGLPVYAASVEPYLHLLTAVTYIGQGILLAIEGWPLPPSLADLDVLRVPLDEAYAANSLGIGEHVIVPAGYPRMAALLAAREFDVLTVPTSEFAKADGGVTCLSLVW
jgi:dimethylargininase